MCHCPAHVHMASARSPGTKAAQRGGSPGNWVISRYLGPSGSLARAVWGSWTPTPLPIPAHWLNGSVITGVGLVWRFPCAAWKGATYCFTTKITNYFIEGWSCRELSGRSWCGTAPAPPAAGTCLGVPKLCPHGSHQYRQRGASDGEGGRGAPGTRAAMSLQSPVPAGAHSCH